MDEEYDSGDELNIVDEDVMAELNSLFEGTKSMQHQVSPPCSPVDEACFGSTNATGSAKKRSFLTDSDENIKPKKSMLRSLEQANFPFIPNEFDDETLNAEPTSEFEAWLQAIDVRTVEPTEIKSEPSAMVTEVPTTSEFGLYDNERTVDDLDNFDECIMDHLNDLLDFLDHATPAEETTTTQQQVSAPYIPVDETYSESIYSNVLTKECPFLSENDENIEPENPMFPSLEEIDFPFIPNIFDDEKLKAISTIGVRSWLERIDVRNVEPPEIKNEPSSTPNTFNDETQMAKPTFEVPSWLYGNDKGNVDDSIIIEEDIMAELNNLLHYVDHGTPAEETTTTQQQVSAPYNPIDETCTGSMHTTVLAKECSFLTDNDENIKREEPIFRSFDETDFPFISNIFNDEMLNAEPLEIESSLHGIQIYTEEIPDIKCESSPMPPIDLDFWLHDTENSEPVLTSQPESQMKNEELSPTKNGFGSDGFCFENPNPLARARTLKILMETFNDDTMLAVPNTETQTESDVPFDKTENSHQN